MEVESVLRHWTSQMLHLYASWFGVKKVRNSNVSWQWSFEIQSCNSPHLQYTGKAKGVGAFGFLGFVYSEISILFAFFGSKARCVFNFAIHKIVAPIWEVDCLTFRMNNRLYTWNPNTTFISYQSYTENSMEDIAISLLMSEFRQMCFLPSQSLQTVS